MDEFSDANDRSGICFRPFHSQNEVDVDDFKTMGETWNSNLSSSTGDVGTNQGGSTLARGMQLGILVK